MGEHLICIQGVAGSTPVISTSLMAPDGNKRFPVLAGLLGLAGILFVASALTPNGLLPSGHGVGLVGELVLGVVLIAYGAFRIWRATRVN